ncbi:hypothetical protein [Candidatus Methylacidiphilum infernorum]|nr:hypothetical protein [Candidatus Methylacidiphilum infernorum]
MSISKAVPCSLYGWTSLINQKKREWISVLQGEGNKLIDRFIGR